EPGALTVAAVHQQGFGRIEVSKTNHTLSIQLQPWGRIEGSLKFSRKSNAGHQIAFFSAPDPSNPSVTPDLGAFSTKADNQGSFVFEQLPPGDFDLFLVPGLGIPFSHRTPVRVQPGETISVQIGGTGRTLSGRFVLSDGSQTVNWSKQMQFATLGTKFPLMPPGLDWKERREWQRRFAE